MIDILSGGSDCICRVTEIHRERVIIEPRSKIIDNADQLAIFGEARFDLAAKHGNAVNFLIQFDKRQIAVGVCVIGGNLELADLIFVCPNQSGVLFEKIRQYRGAFYR